MKIEDVVVELRIEQAVQAEQLKGIDEKVNDIGSDVKDIRKSILGESKASTNFFRSLAFKVILIIVGGSVGGGAITAGISALSGDAGASAKAVIEQPLNE